MVSVKNFDTFSYKEAREAADKVNENGLGIRMFARVVEIIRANADMGLYSARFNRNDLKGTAEYCYKMLFHKGFSVKLTDIDLHVSWWSKC